MKTNKKHDKMSIKISDIYGKVKPVLQEIARLEGQFAVSCAFRTRFCGAFPP